MPQPTLHTDRLLLVPLADRHLDLSVRLNSDPEVLHHLYGRVAAGDGGGRHAVRPHVLPVWDDPLPGADKGEVEYELTREMWVTR